MRATSSTPGFFSSSDSTSPTGITITAPIRSSARPISWIPPCPSSTAGSATARLQQPERGAADEVVHSLTVGRVERPCPDIAVEPLQLAALVQRAGADDLPRQLGGLARGAGGVLLAPDSRGKGRPTA